MNSRVFIARALSAAFLSGDLEVDDFVDRAGRLLGKRWRWLRPLGRRLVETFEEATPPRQVTVTRCILADPGFLRACAKHTLRVVVDCSAPPTMRPIRAAALWSVAPIRTAAELAVRMGLTIRELDWFADRHAWVSNSSRAQLRHYRYRILAKRFGRVRLIESPKPRLKQIQRRILTEILDPIPPHGAAHGFRRRRSILTFAAPHVGQRIVIKFDLEDFFPSVTLPWIQAIFRTVGYPEPVADLLAGLCSNATPADAWESGVETLATPQRRLWDLYSQPHLPQGAPTSPALANLCSYRLDCRLSGLANAVGAVYTRYADDLAFSGGRNLERAAQRFQLHVCATIMEEGFAVHHRKTRIMRRGVPQRLAGLIVNERLNVPRASIDRFKATLTNCIRHGADSQNRERVDDFRSHLEGKVVFVETVNPTRGRQLRELFNQVDW